MCQLGGMIEAHYRGVGAGGGLSLGVRWQVFCLVDLYRSLGEELMPYLDASLSNSQLKLVTIYINRLQS